MLVSEDSGRKTVHLVSSAFLAAVYLEPLTEPVTSVVGLATWLPSFPSGDCEEGNQGAEAAMERSGHRRGHCS